jgi:predicted dehydrogenase
MSKINVAVLGYGHLGKWHCQKVDACTESNLYAIIEPFEAGQKAAKENHPNALIVSDIKEVIDDIDAGVIVTPTSTHFELSKYLLENKKHIFCEKPLCSSMQEVNQLVPLLSEDKVFQVGHSERCHKAWEELESYRNDLDGAYTIDLNRVAEFKGRATDVDVVQDLMIHDLDLVLFLFGKKPTSVKAYGHKIRTDKWDHATALLEFSDGSMAKVTSGRNHVKEIRSLEVMSDKGCLYVDLFENSYSIGTDSTFDNGEFVKKENYEKRDHLLIEHQSFYSAIQGESKAMVNFHEGAEIVNLIDKVLESLDKKERVSL